MEVFIPSADAVETRRVCSSWGLSEGPPEPARTDFDVLPMVLFFRLSGQHGYLTLSCKQSLFTFLSIVGFVGWIETFLLTSTPAFAAAELHS